MKFDEKLRGSYSRAAALFDQLDRLRRLWGRVQPPPPLKKSEAALLGTLAFLQLRGPVTLGVLAQQMHQSPPGISQKVSVLEENGLVRRRAHETDRRAAYVELTDRGRQLSEQAMTIMLERMEEALDSMGERDTDRLLELMGRLINALETGVRHTVPGMDKECGGEAEC